jgi:hypothetical protein
MEWKGGLSQIQKVHIHIHPLKLEMFQKGESDALEQIQ